MNHTIGGHFNECLITYLLAIAAPVFLATALPVSIGGYGTREAAMAAYWLLAGLPAGSPVWYLRDAAYTRDFAPLSGLHREQRAFDEIRAVRDGGPLPAPEWEIIGDVLPAAVVAARESGGFFQLLRGEPVRKGDVFVLRCVALNCFARVEVVDVTIAADPVTTASRSPP
jgi:hypothetical protein